MKSVQAYAGTAYRMHTPRWAHSPTSGAGAGKQGGRANRVGVNALYLSKESQTAVSEYQQLSSLMAPGTLVCYELNIGPVLDFTNGYQSGEWDELWEDFFCDWRSLWFDKRIEPPSWVLGDIAIAAGAKGILFSSRLPAGGVDLVVYTDQLGPGDILKPYDPTALLPRNADSWK